MTTSNYTVLSNTQLLDEINELGVYQGKLNAFLKTHFPRMFDELVERTCFLTDFYKERYIPITARLYCLEHDLNSCPTCQNPNCNNLVGWDKTRKCFRGYCCVKCQSSDEKLKQKREHTNVLKYGHRCSFQSEQVKDKFKKTCQERYGVDNYTKTDEYHERTKTTNILKYGCEYFSQSQQYKDNITSLHRNFSKKWMLSWNDDNGNYLIERYDRITQYQMEHHQMFDSRWEIEVFVFCKFLNSIDCQYSPNVRIPYFVDGHEYGYYPDFLINGRLFEVKGDHFFRLNECTNEIEMFLPWKPSGCSEEQYDFLCTKENAKYHCMLEHGVRILGLDDIRNMSVEMFQ